MPRLSSDDKSLLTFIEHRADIPVPELAKSLKLREHTVRQRLGSLRERKILLGKHAFINFYGLGVADFTLFFNLSCKHQKGRERVLQALCELPQVKWVVEIAGEYQMAAAFFVQTALEVQKVLEQITKRFGNLFQNKAVSNRISLTAYGRRYMAPERHGPPLMFRFLAKAPLVDGKDLEILDFLTRGPFESQRELSKQIALSPSATLERLRRLEKSGVIAGYYYSYDIQALNVQQYRLLIQLRGVDAAVTKRIRTLCETSYNAVHLVECLGEWDCEVGLEVDSPVLVQDFIREVYEVGGDAIERVRILQFIRHLKTS